MSLRKWISLIVVWAVSLIVAGALGYAQVPIRPPLVPLTTPMIISGSDLGFRLEGRRGEPLLASSLFDAMQADSGLSLSLPATVSNG